MRRAAKPLNCVTVYSGAVAIVMFVAAAFVGLRIVFPKKYEGGPTERTVKWLLRVAWYEPTITARRHLAELNKDTLLSLRELNRKLALWVTVGLCLQVAGGLGFVAAVVAALVPLDSACSKDRNE